MIGIGCVSDGISLDGSDSDVVRAVLFGCRRCGGLGTLFDFVHVAERCFNLRGEVFLDSLSCETWPPYVVASLNGPNPCLFDRISGSGVEICDEVGDSLGNVACRGICCVLDYCSFVDVLVIVRFDPFAILVDFLRA